MMHRARYGIYPTFFLLALIGCSDAKTTSEQPGGSPPAQIKTTTDTSTSTADVLRRYYDAINNGQYDTAFAFWDGSGKASKQTRAKFAAGFAQTERTTVTVGDSVRVEGAAGSQYATVPVTIDAVLRNGTHQRFVGSYTLRRSMVDGATPEQRTWRIYSAALQQH
jgi:hypothetical protein